MTETLLRQLDQESLIRERIKNARSVTVEFGTGSSPMLMADKNYTGKEDLYIGVNIDPTQHVYLEDRLPQADGVAVLCSKPISAETPLVVPIPDDCADLAFMGNVLGEPDSDSIMFEFKGADQKYHGNTNDDIKEQTLKEAGRILGPKGRLIVLETYTPKNQGEAIAMLEAANFRIISVVNTKSEDWGDIAAYFSMYYDSGSTTLGSYIIIAEKSQTVTLSDQGIS